MSTTAPRDPSELLISGVAARIIILNAHRIMRHKYRGRPLWALVSDITGHGAGYSWDVCDSANLNGGQNAGAARLEDRHLKST